MQFTQTLVLTASALASIVSATNSILFFNQDSAERTVYFTPSAGSAYIAPITLQGINDQQTVEFPDSWGGNAYSVSEGAANVTGMLAEVLFQGFADQTYFDVSAIVKPDDTQGVKILKPLSSDTPVSGCQTPPCSNAYNAPDDVETLSTSETTLMCLLGTLSSSSKRGQRIRRVDHEFVTGAL